MKHDDDSGKGGRSGDPADLLEQELGDAVVEADTPAVDGVEIEYGEDDEGFWDDLPETEIEIGDDEEFVIEDFDDADLDVYEGLPAEEDIAVEVDASDDEDVVIEAGGEFDEDTFGIDEGFLDDEALWSREQWSECADRMVADARAMEDPSAAARLLAEAGRIHEVRLGQAEDALRLLTSAHELDPGCLPAIQGLRRCHLAGGDVDSARQLVDEEKALAEDATVRDRLEGLDLEIRGWKLDDRGESASGLSRTGAGRGDVYADLVRLSGSLLAADAGGASLAARDVAASASDGLFVSSLESAAGLLAEVAGDGDTAAAAYAAALEAREGEEAAACARWRHHASGQAWAEADRISDLPGLDPGRPLARGHGFLRAALKIMALARHEEAGHQLASLPSGIPEVVLRLLASLGGGAALDEAIEEMESRLPAGRLAAVLSWHRAAGMDDDEAIGVLRGVLEQAPDLDAVSLDVALRLARPDAAERASLLHAMVDEAIERPGTGWLVTEIGLALLDEGRSGEAARVIERVLERGEGRDILWPAVLRLLALAEGEHAASLLGSHGALIEDAALRKAIELTRSVLAGGEAGAPQEDGLAAAASALVAFREGSLEDPDERIDLLRGILESQPAHVLAFAALRRELLAAGRVEEYGRELDAWVASYGTASGRIQGERIALLSLGAGSSLGEQDLRTHLEASGEDSFLPLFIAGLEAFPTLAAESIARIASATSVV